MSVYMLGKSDYLFDPYACISGGLFLMSIICILNFTGNENLMAEMSEKARRAARPNASSYIAKYILSLVEQSSADLE